MTSKMKLLKNLVTMIKQSRSLIYFLCIGAGRYFSLGVIAFVGIPKQSDGRGYWRKAKENSPVYSYKKLSDFKALSLKVSG